MFNMECISPIGRNVMFNSFFNRIIIMYNAFITNFKLDKHYVMTSSNNESVEDFENRVFNKYSKDSHEAFFFETNV